MSGYLDTDIEVFYLRPLMLVELSWVWYHPQHYRSHNQHPGFRVFCFSQLHLVFFGHHVCILDLLVISCSGSSCWPVLHRVRGTDDRRHCGNQQDCRWEKHRACQGCRKCVDHSAHQSQERCQVPGQLWLDVSDSEVTSRVACTVNELTTLWSVD